MHFETNPDLTLRPYQRRAIDETAEWMQANPGKNPILDMCVGSGKSLTIAAMIHEIMEEDPGSRHLVLTHVGELVAQDYGALKLYWPTAPAGIYSAGMGRRELHDSITVASIQSVFRKVNDIGLRDFLYIDEVHLVPHKNGGMYREMIDGLLSINPSMGLIGFTGTPFRTGSGKMIEGEGAIFHGVSARVTMTEMLEQGYLKPLVAKQGKASFDMSKLKKEKGEYTTRSMEAEGKSKVADVCAEIAERGADRKKWMVFASGVNHAKLITQQFNNMGIATELVTGTTPKGERADITYRFGKGGFRCLVNVGTLTTGFNVPDVDLLAMVRSTTSSGLLVQIAGRGMRTAPGVEDCLFLDFGNNILAHGPINLIDGEKKKRRKVKNPDEEEGEELELIEDDEPQREMAKECPKCGQLVPANSAVCTLFVTKVIDDDGTLSQGMCGHEFDLKHEAKASSINPLALKGGKTEKKRERFQMLDVSRMKGELHQKEGKPDSVRLEFWHGMGSTTSLWLCFEHGGRAKKMADQNWTKLGGSLPYPTNTQDALVRINDFMELRRPDKIKVDNGRTPDDFKSIVQFKYVAESLGGDDLEAKEPESPKLDIDLDSIPF